MSEQNEHVVTATYHRGWDEWRSECSCGQVGSYWTTREAAEREPCFSVRARQAQTCPGCGNDLNGDNLCMVSACEQEV